MFKAYQSQRALIDSIKMKILSQKLYNLFDYKSFQIKCDHVHFYFFFLFELFFLHVLSRPKLKLKY